MSDRICYIPLRTGEDLLRNTIDGLYNQVDAFMVINSTERDLFPYFEGHDPEHKVNFINPTDPLCFEQAINVAIKTAYWLYKSPYIIWAHNDLVVYPGAIDALMETYEQYKDTKWGVIYGNYDVLCMFNPRFFVDENIWGDPALFRITLATITDTDSWIYEDTHASTRLMLRIRLRILGARRLETVLTTAESIH